MAETKYIAFQLGKHKYAMQLSRINGIECVYNVVPIPLGAACFRGIIHLRNSVIPVYSLKQRFGEEEDCEESQLLITQIHGIQMAFEVDEVLGIVPVDDKDVKDAPMVVHTDETSYLEHVVNLKLPESRSPEIMLSISVDNIISEHDFSRVSEALENAKEEKE